jgi:hypothetical protein
MIISKRPSANAESKSTTSPVAWKIILGLKLLGDSYRHDLSVSFEVKLLPSHIVIEKEQFPTYPIHS